MTEPTISECRASVIDARQRKRIQNRQAQRTYREKLKRRIEDLERWRDVALAFTSTPTGDDSEDTARYNTALSIPECDSSHSISTYTNDQPVPQLLPSCSSTQELGTQGSTAEETKATSNAYDDLPLYSEWYSSMDSGIAMSEAGTPFSASPTSDFERHIDGQEPQNTVVPSRTDSTISLEMIVVNTPQVTLNHISPPALTEVTESPARSESQKQDPTIDLSNSGKSAIHLAAERGQNSILRLLIDRLPDSNIQDGSGRNALHLAIENNHVDTVKLLLERDSLSTPGTANSCIDVNAQDKVGRSPLHAAVASGNLAVLHLLLQISGVMLNLYDHDGHTPLHRAITQGADDLVEILVENSADLTLPIRV